MTFPEINNPHFARPATRLGVYSTYKTHRLVVTEYAADACLVGYIVTDVHNRTLSDTRLAVGKMSRLDYDGLPEVPAVLFQRAVHLL